MITAEASTAASAALVHLLDACHLHDLDLHLELTGPDGSAPAPPWLATIEGRRPTAFPCELFVQADARTAHAAVTALWQALRADLELKQAADAAHQAAEAP